MGLNSLRHPLAIPLPNRPHRVRSVGKFLRSIRVEDANGAQFDLHEFLIRERVFGYLRRRRRFVLDTGEPADLVDAETFRLRTTGEVFVRAR